MKGKIRERVWDDFARWSDCPSLECKSFNQMAWSLPWQSGQPGQWGTATVVPAHSRWWTQTVLPSRELLASFLEDLAGGWQSRRSSQTGNELLLRFWKEMIEVLKWGKPDQSLLNHKPYLEWNIMSKLDLKRKRSWSIRQWFICTQEHKAKSLSLVSSSQIQDLSQEKTKKHLSVFCVNYYWKN